MRCRCTRASRCVFSSWRQETRGISQAWSPTYTIKPGIKISPLPRQRVLVRDLVYRNWNFSDLRTRPLYWLLPRCMFVARSCLLHIFAQHLLRSESRITPLPRFTNSCWQMTFRNAPVTRAVVLALIAGSITVSLLDIKHYFYILIDTHIWRYGQFWRLFVYQSCYNNSTEVLFAAMSFYNLRIVERLWGSRKYAVSSHIYI